MVAYSDINVGIVAKSTGKFAVMVEAYRRPNGWTTWEPQVGEFTKQQAKNKARRFAVEMRAYGLRMLF